MTKELQSSIWRLRNNSLIDKEMNEFADARKSIEKDEEFIKLYNMTVRKYIDEGLDPNDITFSQIIELDFDYFARTYGVRCFALKSKNKKIEFIDI